MLSSDQFNWLLEANDPDQYASGDEYAKELSSQARTDHDSDLTPEQVQEAHQQWEDVVKIGFEEWNSGFRPESDAQITVYLDYGVSERYDREAVRAALRKLLDGDFPIEYYRSCYKPSKEE